MSQNLDDILTNLGAAIKASASGVPLTKGIVDNATREQLVVTDAGVLVSSLTVENYKGDLTVAGKTNTVDLAVSGTGTFSNVNVNGKLKVDTLEVKKVLSDSSVDNYSKAITFNGDSPRELDGLGFLWNEGELTRQFVYKAEPRRIFSTETIDLYKTADYKIDGSTVINKTQLGPTVRDSRLKTVGPLDELTVVGNTTLSESVFISSSTGRVGVMTDQPNAALSVVDNNTEVVLGAFEDGVGFVGTWGARGFSIITDHTQRVTVKGNTVEFGNEKSKGAVVKIYGTLEVDSIVADTRVERTSPIEFVASKDTSIFGKGMLWSGEGGNRKFVMMPNPDRLFSTESIDLAVNKEFSISKTSVLNQTTLGSTVVNSSLKTLGTLTGLSVDGPVDLGGSLVIENRTVSFNNSVNVNSGTGNITISSQGITAQKFAISNGAETEFEVDTDGALQLGNRNNTTRTINAYGKLSVNITNPDPNVSFSVDGMVMMNNKRFSSGERAPTSGQWSKGDIVWNTNPQETSYVGWVCTMTGTPGTWKPFGLIGK